MADIERAHLRAAAAAGGGDGEAHLVEDIHERQRAGGVGAGARDVGAARPQRRMLVADAAARLERKPGLVDLLEDVVHRVADRARHRAVDGRGGGLVLERTGVGGHAAGGNRAAAQRPQEALVPVLAHVLALDVRERARHAFVGIVHRLVDGRTVLGGRGGISCPRCRARLPGKESHRCPWVRSSRLCSLIRGAPMFLRLIQRIAGNAGQSAMGLLGLARLTGTCCRVFGSQVPETSPRPRDPDSLVANTRSCVGVKSLMTVPGVVKRCGRIL